MARDEWQWIDNFPKIRLLLGQVERDPKYATTHLAEASMRIERGRAEDVGNIVTFSSRSDKAKDLALQLSP